MKYGVDYFIKKFSAIPEELWMTGDFTDGTRYCVLGHCGERDDIMVTRESRALRLLFKTGPVVGPVFTNDDAIELGPTPKTRVLAALRRIKEKI